MAMKDNNKHMLRILGNIENKLSASSKTIPEASAHPDVIVSLDNKCEPEEISAAEVDSDLDSERSSPADDSEVLIEMVETINREEELLKSYGCQIFGEIPNWKLDMKVEDSMKNHTVKHETQVFDEMIHTFSAVKCDHVMVDNQLALPSVLPSCSHSQRLRLDIGIFDYLSGLDHVKIGLSLHQFTFDQFGCEFPFDPGSSLFITLLKVTRSYLRNTADAYESVTMNYLGKTVLIRTVMGGLSNNYAISVGILRKLIKRRERSGASDLNLVVDKLIGIGYKIIEVIGGVPIMGGWQLLVDMIVSKTIDQVSQPGQKIKLRTLLVCQPADAGGEAKKMLDFRMLKNSDALEVTIYCAMVAPNDTKIIVMMTISGRPSKGESTGLDATLDNIYTYANNLINHVLLNKTMVISVPLMLNVLPNMKHPMHPEQVISVLNLLMLTMSIGSQTKQACKSLIACALLHSSPFTDIFNCSSREKYKDIPFGTYVTDSIFDLCPYDLGPHAKVLPNIVDIRTLQLRWLWYQIGLVHLELALASTTLLENILYGRLEVQWIEVKIAAFAAIVLGKKLFFFGCFNEGQCLINVYMLVDATTILCDIYLIGQRENLVIETIVGEHTTDTVLDSNLEDKVLIEDGSIVMNQPKQYIGLRGVIGLRRIQRTRRPLKRLIWDQGPISAIRNWLKALGVS
ncbi:hypothetical protein A4A49_26471 [Nicotiana attenuata]|uniref:Uncharacterized protein n=1 Tax=Nicotiana attenuata TaxID=49451 RepID=A0A1J6K9F1_NICAT|nr:hypothetical protein A4A49_26471 [Nicotiana attenuata]